mmetsp:Transcript_114842/g.199780  ORF Transcript_114842/g.199780 Transcript_114842/m.199780 type:complete len:98 (+) Transcript_114842:1700-1993(+)
MLYIMPSCCRMIIVKSPSFPPNTNSLTKLKKNNQKMGLESTSNNFGKTLRVGLHTISVGMYAMSHGILLSFTSGAQLASMRMRKQISRIFKKGPPKA